MEYEYQWPSYPERDLLALRFFHTVDIPTLNVSPLYARVDAKGGSAGSALDIQPDCGHYCLGVTSALRLVPILLHNLLVDLREKEQAANKTTGRGRPASHALQAFLTTRSYRTCDEKHGLTNAIKRVIESKELARKGTLADSRREYDTLVNRSALYSARKYRHTIEGATLAARRLHPRDRATLTVMQGSLSYDGTDHATLPATQESFKYNGTETATPHSR